jgi:hypothetical protein
MSIQDLQEECFQEFGFLDETLIHLNNIPAIVNERALNVYEKAGTAHLLGNMYTGVENIFKRICKFSGVPLPVGDTSHLTLLEFFCNRPNHPQQLPILIPSAIELDMMQLRKFRHRVMHGYGFLFDDTPLVRTIEQIPHLYKTFHAETQSFLNNLHKRDTDE